MEIFFLSVNSLFGHFASGPLKWLSCDCDDANINISYCHLIEPMAWRTTAGGNNLLQVLNNSEIKLIFFSLKENLTK